MLAAAVFLVGALLLFRPLPTLICPPARPPHDFTRVLEAFIDQAQVGVPIPTAMQRALDVDFLPDVDLPKFITARYITDPIAQQFSLMWENLQRRGAGIVDGAMVLAQISQEQKIQNEELEAKTSGARATFGLLVFLPVWFLVVGQLIGLPALSVLLSHFWGYVLIGIAALLMWLGHRWMVRILAAV